MAENMIVEEALPYFSLSGDCHCWEGASTEEFPQVPPSQIIQLDQSWYWGVHFLQDGDLCDILAGTWRAEFFLEKMGGGEFGFPDAFRRLEFPFVQSHPMWTWRPMNVPPRQVPVGVYRGIISLTFRGLSNRPGPIAAFADMGLLQFYED